MLSTQISNSPDVELIRSIDQLREGEASLQRLYSRLDSQPSAMRSTFRICLKNLSRRADEVERLLPRE
jgi:hypothetical protein